MRRQVTYGYLLSPAFNQRTLLLGIAWRRAAALKEAFRALRGMAGAGNGGTGRRNKRKATPQRHPAWKSTSTSQLELAAQAPGVHPPSRKSRKSTNLPARSGASEPSPPQPRPPGSQLRGVFLGYADGLSLGSSLSKALTSNLIDAVSLSAHDSHEDDTAVAVSPRHRHRIPRFCRSLTLAFS